MEKKANEALGWKRAFGDKEDELQQVQIEAKNTLAEAEQICHDADRDLAQALVSVKQQKEQLELKNLELSALHEALVPLLDMIPEAKGDCTVPILERIKSVPSCLGKYINDMARMIVTNILATFQVHLPQLDLNIINRKPRVCTNADISKASKEMQELATECANSLGLVDQEQSS